MIFLAAFLGFLAWTAGLEACSPGLGLDQLRTNVLVGQMSDDPRNPMSFAASLDPATQTMSVSQLACNGFDNKCPWRTSNLSTLPWFQSNYKFDSNVLKYATGTDVQPDGDYAIAVSQLVNRTDYAVLESPSFCQVGNGYLQLMLWASQGVKVQACSKANSASSFDFCTLFMTENQPGPYSVIIPQPSATPLKIYIVATNFNYTDSQYSGGFAAVDQIAYSGTDCTAQPASAPSTGPPASSILAAQSPLSASTLIAPNQTSPTAVPTTLLTNPLSTNKPAAQTGNGIPQNASRTEPEKATDVPDVSVTSLLNTYETTTQQSNKSTFYFPQDKMDEGTPGDDSEQSGSGSASGSNEDGSTELLRNSGSGSGDNETDSNMFAAKSDDELEGSGSDNEDESSDNGPSFVFNLPEDVTASSSTESGNKAENNPQNTQTATSVELVTTTIESTTAEEPTTTQAVAMPANYIASSNNQPVVQKTDPKKILPERIKNLLYTENNSTEEQEASKTTLSSKQQTLINQLYNNRQTALEPIAEPETPKDPNQEELPQIFHPSANNHPRPHQKQHFLTTTKQPPWYEFTTLYPGQRRNQQTAPQPFYLNSWIETSSVRFQKRKK